jgi:hypothetical protein
MTMTVIRSTSASPVTGEIVRVPREAVIATQCAAHIVRCQASLLKASRAATILFAAMSEAQSILRLALLLPR